MPKHFDQKQRDMIVDQLEAIGLRQFAKSGVRATRVEELCKAVGIAKGSFYSFFASKEALFMHIANKRDQLHKRELMRELKEHKGSSDQRISDLFRSLRHRTETDPVLQILRDMSELQHLVRSAPAELHAKNRQQDEEFVEDLAQILRVELDRPLATRQDIEQIMAIMMSVSLQRETLEAVGLYDSAMEQVHDLFLARLKKGPEL